MRDYKYKKQGSAKYGALLFFKIYYEKFWRLAAVNFLYFVAVFPLFSAVYAGVAVNVLGQNTLIGADILVSIFSYLPIGLRLPSVILSAVIYGPLKMGVTYVYKCFLIGEHVYGTDVFLYALRNAKQGLAFGFLDLFVVSVLIYNIFAELGMTGAAGTALDMAGYISMTMLALYVMIRHYFYLMAVSAEFKIAEIIKNSVLLSVLKLGQSLGLALACTAVWGIVLLSVPAVTIIFVPFMIYSVCGILTAMSCWPIIDDCVIAE